MAKQAPHQRSMKAQIMNSNKRIHETWGDQPWLCRETEKGLSGEWGETQQEQRVQQSPDPLQQAQCRHESFQNYLFIFKHLIDRYKIIIILIEFFYTSLSIF